MTLEKKYYAESKKGSKLMQNGKKINEISEGKGQV
jgi:hypothetical protein